MNSVLVALALTAGTADAGPYMWGVGPSLSTMVMPGEHPLSWPVAKKIDGDRPAVAPYGKNDSGRLSEPYFEKKIGQAESFFEAEPLTLVTSRVQEKATRHRRRTPSTRCREHTSST